MTRLNILTAPVVDHDSVDASLVKCVCVKERSVLVSKFFDTWQGCGFEDKSEESLRKLAALR